MYECSFHLHKVNIGLDYYNTAALEGLIWLWALVNVTLFRVTLFFPASFFAGKHYRQLNQTM